MITANIHYLENFCFCRKEPTDSNRGEEKDSWRIGRGGGMRDRGEYPPAFIAK
jgi:hypothetical protein